MTPQDKALELAHRIAWRYKKSSDPNHSDTWTFNKDTLLQFVAALSKPASVPGFVLVPVRMTQAMRDVTDSEDWTWEDLLAAAGVITEAEYEALAAAPQAQPAQADMKLVAIELERIASEPPISGNHLAKARVLLTAESLRGGSTRAFLAQPASTKERWNIERDGNALLVCFNSHEKGEACRYERFVPEAQPASVPAEPNVGHSALAGLILTHLGYSTSPSLEPCADGRRDRLAEKLAGWLAAAPAAPQPAQADMAPEYAAAVRELAEQSGMSGAQVLRAAIRLYQAERKGLVTVEHKEQIGPLAAPQPEAQPSIQDLAAGAHYPQVTGWPQQLPAIQVSAADGTTTCGTTMWTVSQPASVPADARDGINGLHNACMFREHCRAMLAAAPQAQAAEPCAICDQGSALLVRVCSHCGSEYAGAAEMAANAAAQPQAAPQPEAQPSIQDLAAGAHYPQVSAWSAAPSAQAEPAGKNWHAHHVAVNKAALQMIRNALRNDAEAGKQSRAEMLEELDKATFAIPKQAEQGGE